MGIIDRLIRLLRAAINQQLDRAENPEALLEQVIRDMQSDLAAARVQTRNMIAQEKELEAELASTRSATQTWAAKAEAAVAAQRDDLARVALRRKRDSEEVTRVYAQQLELQRATVTRLKEQVRRLEAQYESARSRKDAMIARHRRAKASGEVAKHLSPGTADQDMRRVHRKIRAAEAKAAAADEIATSSVDAQLSALDDPGLERELQAIKARIAKSGADSGPALPAQYDDRDELDMLDDRPEPGALPPGLRPDVPS
jgi:phage shock protein A